MSQRDMITSTITFMTFMALFVGFDVAPVEAVTRNIPSQYPTLQAAVNAAKNGDTILIAPSSTPYQIGTVTISPVTASTTSWNLTIRGQADPTQTILQGTIGFHPTGPSPAVLLLFGVTIRRSPTVPVSVGAYVNSQGSVSAEFRLMNCVIAQHNYGAAAESGGKLVVYHSLIRDTGYGVVLYQGNTSVTVHRSALINNGQAGIAATGPDSATVTVTQSVISFNGRIGITVPKRGGIWLGSNSSGTIKTQDTIFVSNSPAHITKASGVIFTDLGKTVYLDPTNGQML